MCAAKNWDVADAIRDQLRDMGLVIEDTAAGTRIKQPVGTSAYWLRDELPEDALPSP